MRSITKNTAVLLKNTKKSWTFGLVCCFLAFSLPVHSHAKDKAPEQEILQMPSAGGKLDLTPQIQKENPDTQNEKEEKSLTTGKNPANLPGTQQTQTIQETQKQHSPAAQKDVILAPGHHDSMRMEEDGSNVMIVHGQNKIPENYTNSTNINNGFYMNITNPDGSGMNMGTYFNSNSNTNSPGKRSKAQIIIDKKE